jgi:hypothetical protein
MSRTDSLFLCAEGQHDYVAFTDIAQRCRTCGALLMGTPAWGSWVAVLGSRCSSGEPGTTDQDPAISADTPYLDDVDDVGGTVIWPPSH